MDVKKLYEERLRNYLDPPFEEITGKVFKVGNSHAVMIRKEILHKLKIGVGDSVVGSLSPVRDFKEEEKIYEDLKYKISLGGFSKEETMNFWSFLNLYFEGVKEIPKKITKDYDKIRGFLEEDVLDVNLEPPLSSLVQGLKQDGTLSKKEIDLFLSKVLNWFLDGKKKELIDYFDDEKKWKGKLEAVISKHKELMKK